MPHRAGSQQQPPRTSRRAGQPASLAPAPRAERPAGGTTSRRAPATRILANPARSPQLDSATGCAGQPTQPQNTHRAAARSPQLDGAAGHHLQPDVGVEIPQPGMHAYGPIHLNLRRMHKTKHSKVGQSRSLQPSKPAASAVPSPARPWGGSRAPVSLAHSTGPTLSPPPPTITTTHTHTPASAPAPGW